MPYQRIATVIGNKSGEERESLFGIGGFEQTMSIYLLDALLGIVFGDAPIGYNLYLLNLLDFAVYGDVMIGRSLIHIYGGIQIFVKLTFNQHLHPSTVWRNDGKRHLAVHIGSMGEQAVAGYNFYRNIGNMFFLVVTDGQVDDGLSIGCMTRQNCE